LDIRRVTLEGFKWLALFKALSQMFTWVITIFVIRILSPDDYGVMALATIFISFFAIIYEVGLGSAIVQALDVSRRQLRSVFGFVIVVNAVFFVIFYIFSDAVARYFNETELSFVIEVLAFKFVFVAFSVIPGSILQRDMRFKESAAVALVSSITGAVSTLLFALYGAEVWSLVWGSLISGVVGLLVLYYINPVFLFPSFKFGDIYGLMSFGGVVVLERVVWYLYSQADSVIVGKMLGGNYLGIYSVSMQLSSTPMQKVNSVVNQVAFSAFSRTQEDKVKFRKGFLLAVRYLSVISFPVFWGISVTAFEVVPVVLGERWESCVYPVMALSIIMPVRMISNIYPTILRALGRPWLSLGNLMVACLVMPPAFFMGVDYGLLGVCAAWVLAYPLVFFVETYRTIKCIGFTFVEFFAEVLFPACMSLAMVFGVVLFKLFVDVDVLWVFLVGEVFVGIVIYLFGFWYFKRLIFNELVVMLRG